MARRVRLDSELVRRGLARSRGQAGDLIEAGRVLVDGTRAAKAATQIQPAQALRVLPPPQDAAPEYASRGGHKLAGALDLLGARAPRIRGQRALDAGASTGGFTDVLLRRGAAHVVAVDVGYGQLDWRLRNDERVTVLERTNVRTLTPEQVAPPPALVVADLSFISLRLVLGALVEVAAPGADLLLMVKPQFEVGAGNLGAGGVVREPELRAGAIRQVARAAEHLGVPALAVVPSPLPGPSGNVEYFLHLRTSENTGEPVADALDEEALEVAIATALRTGPSGAS